MLEQDNYRFWDISNLIETDGIRDRAKRNIYVMS